MDVSPLLGQEKADPETYARLGMTVGAVSGGLAGGLILGAFSDALCEGGCPHPFREGFTLGAMGGFLLGGLTGLVVGSAIPRPETKTSSGPPGPWNLRLGAGPRWAGSGEVKGVGIWVGLSALRPTSNRIKWGVEVAYLGGGENQKEFTISERDGTTTHIDTRTRRRLWNLSLVATRALGRAPAARSYALADVGVFPLQESLRSISEPGFPVPGLPSRITEKTVEWLPGVGLGIGGVWRVEERFNVGLESRFRAILGAINEPFLPVFSVGLTLVPNRSKPAPNP